MATETGWVTPPIPIRGLDHLGAQAPCIALYSELLPGITNATDRARYFSFHPWFIWSFETRFDDHSEPSYARELRRADCLMTLVAIRHRHVTQEAEEVHDVGTTGNRALGAAYARLQESGVIAVDDYAGFEASNRYFKNRWGGLGQYYFGPLVDLRIVDYVAGAAIPGYDRTRGVALARAFEASVPTDRFFEVLHAGIVTTADLDTLAPFCHCQLKRNAAEQDLLLDVLLARRSDGADDGRDARRDTMGLLLHVVQAARPKDLQWALRAGAYSGTLPAREPWSLPQRLERTRLRWGVYHRNELLSVAVQGLFWGILQAMHQHHRGLLRSAAEAGDVLVELVRATVWRDRLAVRVHEAVHTMAAELPPLGAWEEPEHENQHGLRVDRVAGRFDLPHDGIGPTVGSCIAILIALLAREGEPSHSPYVDFDLPPERFGGDQIDLVSFRTGALRWRDLTVEEWVRWLAENWCVRRHLNVALTKLRSEGRDTFRIRPLDNGLRLVEVAPATFTGPRVDRAQQLLFDLGLIERAADGCLTLTALGTHELEAFNG